MYYKFQESLIWEAGDPVDKTRKPVKIKARSEERARRKLPAPAMGRNWVLVETTHGPGIEVVHIVDSLTNPVALCNGEPYVKSDAVYRGEFKSCEICIKKAIGA